MVAGAAGRLGAQRLGLLGTRPVMEGRYYHDRLGSHGFEVIAPEVADREFVHRLIFEELTRGQFTQASRTAFMDIIGKLDAAGAEAVVLGCTKFGLLVKQSDVPETPLLDTTGLYIEAIVKEALAA